jgi:putative membrane protein
MFYAALVVIILILSCAVLVAIQNSLPVSVSLLSWSYQTSLAVIIFGAATFGALAVLSLAVPVQVKARWELKKARQQHGELEAELKTLQGRLDRELAKDMTKNDL